MIAIETPVCVGVDDYAAADDWLVDWDCFAGSAVREALAEAFARRAAMALAASPRRSVRPSILATRMRALVAVELGITPERIGGAARDRLTVRARDAVTWGLKMGAGVTAADIGRATDRDASTISIALARAGRLRDSDERFRQLTDLLIARFAQGKPS